MGGSEAPIQVEQPTLENSHNGRWNYQKSRSAKRYGEEQDPTPTLATTLLSLAGEG